MGYEQMELDVTLTCDRELKDNVGLAVEFACRQIAAQNQKVVESNHEGYGIAAEGKVAQSETTPMEEYLGDQDGEFEEAEDQDPEDAEEMQEDNEDE